MVEETFAGTELGGELSQHDIGIAGKKVFISLTTIILVHKSIVVAIGYNNHLVFSNYCSREDGTIPDSIGRIQKAAKRNDYSKDSTMYFNKLPEPIPFERYFKGMLFFHKQIQLMRVH